MTARIINLYSTPNKDVESNNARNSMQSTSSIITSSFFLKNPKECKINYPNELLKLKKIAIKYITEVDKEIEIIDKRTANQLFRLYTEVLKVAGEV